MSGQNRYKIIEGMKGLSLSPDGVIIEAKVKSVDGLLLTCEADGLDIPEVQLMPIKTAGNKSFVLVPKVGSYVMIGSIEGRQNYFVLGVNEAEKVVSVIGEISFEINETGIKINGDEYEGLVKVGDLVARLNKLEARANDILTKLTSISVVLAPTGTYPLAPHFTGMLPLSNTKKSDLENSKVKHG